jgi:DNA-3-methyladenine glycosylase
MSRRDDRPVNAERLGDAEGFGEPSASEAKLPRSFFARPVLEVARDLIGATVLVDGIGGIIVESEAYSHEDPASHSFRGRTARNASMFGPPGHAYVYLSYGMHWCANLVCQKAGLASAVLLRALEPVDGLDVMRRRRAGVPDRELCSGPGKLCQALGIDRTLDGARMSRSPVIVRAPERGELPHIAATPRIGITKAVDWPLRFHVVGSPWLSRKEKGGRPGDLPP